MHNYPKTKAEAEAHTYGYSFQQFKYRRDQCAWTVWSGGRGTGPGQCGRYPGHGPEALYCGQHATEIEYIEGTKPRPKAKSTLKWELESANRTVDDAARSVAATLAGLENVRQNLPEDVRAALDAYEAAVMARNLARAAYKEG